jgi:hypothetical protein
MRGLDVQESLSVARTGSAAWNDVLYCWVGGDCVSARRSEETTAADFRRNSSRYFGQTPATESLEVFPAVLVSRIARRTPLCPYFAHYFAREPGFEAAKGKSAYWRISNSTAQKCAEPPLGGTQNPAPFTGHEGSTPSSSTIEPNTLAIYLRAASRPGLQALNYDRMHGTGSSNAFVSVFDLRLLAHPRVARTDRVLAQPHGATCHAGEALIPLRAQIE